MDKDQVFTQNEPQHALTDPYIGNILMNDDFLTDFPSQRILRHTNLNFHRVDYAKGQENLQKLKDNYRNKISKVSEKKNQLKSNIGKLVESTSDTLREIQINDLSFKVISEEVNDAYKDIEEAKNTLNQLRNEKLQLQSLLESKTEEYESQYSRKKYRDQWSLKLSHLQNLLGVTVSNQNGAMNITFSKLSNSNQYRTCSIVLKVKNDRFIGISSDPPIKNFSKLISDLNNGLDFGSFLFTKNMCVITKGIAGYREDP